MPYYSRKAAAAFAKKILRKQPFPNRYRQIYAEIANLKPRCILEIGTNDGINALRMLDTARHYNANVEYYGFDLFEALTDQDLDREFSLPTPSRIQVLRHFERKGAKSVFLFSGDTTETLPEMAPRLPPMDFIFIDGGHSYETVAADWTNIQPLIHSETVVLFDDYPNFGIKPVINRLDQEQWHVEVLPTIDRFPAAEFNSGGDAATKVREFQIVKVTASESAKVAMRRKT